MYLWITLYSNSRGREFRGNLKIGWRKSRNSSNEEPLWRFFLVFSVSFIAKSNKETTNRSTYTWFSSFYIYFDSVFLLLYSTVEKDTQTFYTRMYTHVYTHTYIYIKYRIYVCMYMYTIPWMSMHLKALPHFCPGCSIILLSRLHLSPSDSSTFHFPRETSLIWFNILFAVKVGKVMEGRGGKKDGYEGGENKLSF